MSRILRHLPDVESIYFKSNAGISERERKAGYVIVTADKGLAGSYNHNILKLVDEQITRHARESRALGGKKWALHSV